MIVYTTITDTNQTFDIEVIESTKVKNLLESIPCKDGYTFEYRYGDDVLDHNKLVLDCGLMDGHDIYADIILDLDLRRAEERICKEFNIPRDKLYDKNVLYFSRITYHVVYGEDVCIKMKDLDEALISAFMVTNLKIAIDDVGGVYMTIFECAMLWRSEKNIEIMVEHPLYTRNMFDNYMKKFGDWIHFRTVPDEILKML